MADDQAGRRSPVVWADRYDLFGALAGAPVLTVLVGLGMSTWPAVGLVMVVVMVVASILRRRAGIASISLARQMWRRLTRYERSPGYVNSASENSSGSSKVESIRRRSVS
jgi:hypothetical protein